MWSWPLLIASRFTTFSLFLFSTKHPIIQIILMKFYMKIPKMTWNSNLTGTKVDLHSLPNHLVSTIGFCSKFEVMVFRVSKLSTIEDKYANPTFFWCHCANFLYGEKMSFSFCSLFFPSVFKLSLHFIIPTFMASPLWQTVFFTQRWKQCCIVDVMLRKLLISFAIQISH